MSKSPRPMGVDSNTAKKGNSITVKICSVRNVKKEDLLCRVKYGIEARQTKPSKKGTWDEETNFTHTDEKTLIVEVLTAGLLGSKTSLGEATVNLGELKPGVTSNWYPIRGKKDKDIGEIQISIDIPKPAPKKQSLKEAEELLGAFEVTTPRSPKEVDVVKELETLATGKARLVVEDLDLTFENPSLNIEMGALVVAYSGPDSSLTIRLPRTFASSASKEFKKNPITGFHFVDQKLKLQSASSASFELKSTNDATYDFAFNGRAISLENKNSKRLKGIFKLDKPQVDQLIANDELSAFERPPETVVGELINAAFKNNIEQAKKCIERGDDVNEGDENGETALHKAVARGHEEVIKLLVDAGADPRQNNKWSQSPTDVASKFRPDLVPLLHSYF